MRKTLFALLLVIFASGLFLALQYYHATVQTPERSGVHERMFTISTKPVDIPSHVHSPEDTHYDHAVWADGEFRIPEDVWMTAFSTFIPDMVFPPHSFFITTNNAQDPWCPEYPAYIYAAGTVTGKRKLELPSPYGIFLERGTVLRLLAMFHNSDGRLYPAVQFSVFAEYEPAFRTTREKRVSKYVVSASGCDRSRPLFPLPPQSYNITKTSKGLPFVFSQPGVILRMGAHFHGSYAEGVENTIHIVLNGEKIDTFVTKNVGDDEQRNPPLLLGKTPFRIQEGDKLWIEVVFNNPEREIVPEAMALVGFYFIPDQK